MQISMKCSVAVHCLIFIHEAKGIAKVTSNLLAESTGSNPVVIRNILSALKKAGLNPLRLHPHNAPRLHIRLFGRCHGSFSLAASILCR